MNSADWERAAALYLPLTAALIARLLLGRTPRQFAACLLSALWTLPALLILQRMNEVTQWWSFPGETIRLRGMPLELFLGWIVLWGLLPQMAFPSLGIVPSAAIMVALDCLVMPLCKATVHLGPNWLIGECVAVALVLLPSRCIAVWTQSDAHLRVRAMLQLVLAGMLFLFLIPEIAFALRSGAGWIPLLKMPDWLRQLVLQLVSFLALPGIAAVMEFAERGAGTPIPYDPPQRLVTSGIYRYVANPMQLSCTAVLLAWAGVLRNGWLVFAACISLAYSAGLAEWDEQHDLMQRFGLPWKIYRSAVRNWLPRWRPHHAGNLATIYIAATCEPCSQIHRWLTARDPLGLQIADAERLPEGSIQRMRYDPGDGTPPVDGVRAMGRALEHLNLAWALSGIVLRLPGVWQMVQLLMDASGLGPRLLHHATCSTNEIAPDL